MTGPADPGMIPHGSVAGYEAGCRTRAMCPHGPEFELLTCAEAAVRRRGDYRLMLLPADQPLLRHPVAVERQVASPGEVHGTPWGYARGCRDARGCPNWRRGAMTCAEARRRYFRDYAARRATGIGAPIDHGTSNGYLLGCRDSRLCPRDADGVSCSEARAAHRRRLARAAGIAPRAESMDADSAAEKVRRLRSSGWSLRRIAAESGCGRTTIARLADSSATRTRIAPETLRRILSVPVG